jgi:hypothetical protein
LKIEFKEKKIEFQMLKALLPKQPILVFKLHYIKVWFRLWLQVLLEASSGFCFRFFKLQVMAGLK